MKRLWLDYETRSTVDLKDRGLDVYSKSSETDVLMLAWAFDDEEPALWQPIRGEEMPLRLAEGLADPSVVKMAWNYNFEKSITEHRLGLAIPQEQWEDPNVLCAYMSLPISLDRASKALRLDIEMAKTVTTGKMKPVKMFSEQTKTLKSKLKKDPTLPPFYYKDWTTHPEKWEEFCQYCLQDVRAERAVYYAAVAYNSPVTEEEHFAWLLDQRMNHTGVYVDQIFVNNALDLALTEVNGILAEIKSITSLDNPNSTAQLGSWLRERKYPFESLDKEHIAEALKEQARYGMSPLALTVLDLKQKLGGAAYTKLQSIIDRIGPDGRLRDQFVYHGAHTGRWSGRGVQLQNLFKPTKDVSTLRDAIVAGIKAKNLDLPAIYAAYNQGVADWNLANPEKPAKKPMVKCPTTMDAVAGTIRSAFAATPGSTLLVGDLAQIESRVLAALAHCQTMIDAYANGLDLYKDIMAFLLEKPYNDITPGERANGKVIILGCGFGMGWEKFIEYAATFGVTLTEATAKKYVTAFREKYSEIPDFWKALDSACIRAVKLNVCVYVNGLIVDGRNPEMLKIKLPSKRYIHYLRPVITEETTDWGKVREGVSYEAWDARGKQMKRLYGGLLCENVVQAVARDILLSGMFEAEKALIRIIMTIHDEIVGETKKDSGLTVDTLLKAMQVVPAWGEGMGFVLAAEGYQSDYYRK